MGLLGSAFGRGLAGGANAAGDLANKYVDEALAQQRAEAMATLQRKTAGLIRADDDAFRNDPAKIARDRGNKVADIEAEGGARNATALAGAKAMATDTELRQAKIDAENAFVTGTSQAKSDAEAQGYERMTPLMARRAAATADADARTRAKYREAPPDVADKITKIEKVLGRPLDEQEKLGVMGLVKNGRDPELDTETVTEEKMNPDGTVTRTTRKKVRRPGEEAAAEKPPQNVAHAEAMDAIKRGASPDAINKRLADNGYAPLPSKEKPKPVRSEPKPQTPMNLIQEMSTSDLKRLSNIQGHAKQREAQEELRRRQGSGDESPPDTAGSLNLGA